MSDIKSTDEQRLVARGLPEEKVREMLVHWMDWCAELTRVVAEAETPFLALPYAVQVGKRARLGSPVEENQSMLAGATA
jgi:hypothetical protein